jgi:hypothetical protein
MSQIEIVGKVIPWKIIDNNIEAFEIVVTIDNDTLLFEDYTSESIGKPSQYPEVLFKVYCPHQHGQLQSTIRYGQAGNKENWSLEIHEVKLTGREEQIEIEYHFQEYYETGEEFLSEFTFKKIYKLPDDLFLKSVWNYKIESTARYIISNSSGYLLYGQSDEGYCEGILFKESETGDYEQYYTGGYNYSRNAECPLYNESVLVSTIRDGRRSQDKFLITEPGHYMYAVRLGFGPYELNSEFGHKPFYSVEQANAPATNNIKYIKEYFELTDEFEIK